MTSRWSKSAGESTEAPKSSYLIEKNIKKWGYEEVEQEE